MPQKSAPQEPNSDTMVKERLQELVRTRWQYSLSKMAQALRLPQPGLWKIVKSDLPLNANVLVALARHTDVNIHWLVTGHGSPFRDGEAALLSGDAIVRPKVPVAKQLLPGRPSGHPNDWEEPTFDPLGVLSPTQYWVDVKRSDPIVRYKEEQVRLGDWLLLETDPLRFPPQDSIDGKLVVVPGSFQGKSRAPELARVLDAADDCLEVERFDLGIDPSLLDEEIVLRKRRDGKFHLVIRKVLGEQPKAKGRRPKRDQVVDPTVLLNNIQWVKYADLLAVCVLRMGQP
jgi:hypothetical protein